MASCHNMGTFYELGQGVKQDYTKALELFKKACDRAYGPACASLGELYIDGRGAQADIKLARRYLSRACELGGRDACKRRKEIKK